MGSQDEVGQTVSVRSESMHLLPSELINVTIMHVSNIDHQLNNHLDYSIFYSSSL